MTSVLTLQSKVYQPTEDPFMDQNGQGQYQNRPYQPYAMPMQNPQSLLFSSVRPIYFAMLTQI